MMRKYQLVRIDCSMSQIINITELVAIESYLRLTLVSYAETMHTTRQDSTRGGQKAVCMITHMLSQRQWHHRCSSSSRGSARHSC